LSSNLNKKRGSSGRIKLLITIGIIALFSYASKAQLVSSDTVVCIIDTTKSHVKYRENPFAGRCSVCSEYHWQVSIKGHYYDIQNPIIRILQVLYSILIISAVIILITQGLGRLKYQKENQGSVYC